jgi:hypothetical protein
VPLAAEDFVEGAAVRAVAVEDQEPDALLGELEAEVTRLLGDPVTARILRAAREPDAPARVPDEEQHVVAAQKRRLDGEEIAGDDARRLRSQELAPAWSAAPRREASDTPPGGLQGAAPTLARR